MFWRHTDPNAELQRQQIPLKVCHGYKQLVESLFKQHLPQTAPDPVGLCWKKKGFPPLHVTHMKAVYTLMDQVLNFRQTQQIR